MQSIIEISVKYIIIFERAYEEIYINFMYGVWTALGIFFSKHAQHTFLVVLKTVLSQ